MRKLFLTFSLLGIALAVPGIGAQAKHGTITGAVSDPTQAVIPGVQVTLINSETHAAIKTLTDESGKFKLEAAPGVYDLSAYLQGFETSKVTNVQLDANQSQQFNLTLQIKGPSGHVTLIGQ